jgi:hypothetical protein
MNAEIKAAFWLLFSISIEIALLLLWVFSLSGCATVSPPAPQSKAVQVLDVLAPPSAPVPTMFLVWNYPPSSCVAFEIDETTNLGEPFHEIGTTTNLEFPFAADLPQEFFRVGAFRE